MKPATVFAYLFLSASVFAAVAMQPEQLFGFAKQLADEGDQAFALLEYKRFVYLYPKHAKAPEALLRSAAIYLTYAADIDKAQQCIGRVEKQYGKSEVATRARELRKFIEVNSDYEGKPLVGYLRAKSVESKEKFAGAVEKYTQVAEQWPKAQLADDALLAAARIQLHQLKKPKKARETFQLLVGKYPKSPLAPEARFEAAVAVEQISGAGPEAIAAYRKVAQAYPKSDIGTKAAKRVTELEKKAHILKRQFGKDYVLDYAVLREGYESRSRYKVIIKLPTQASQRNVQATLEGALLDVYQKRRDPKDSVRVEAYFNYPFTEAGRVTWTPGQDPAYKLEKRKNEDVIKDVFIDILKGK